MESQFTLGNIVMLVSVLGAYVWGYLKNKAVYEANQTIIKMTYEANQKILQAELEHIKNEMRRMNGNVASHQDWIVKHLEDCHAN